MIFYKVMPPKISIPEALRAAAMNNWCRFNIEIGHLFPRQSCVNAELQDALAPNNAARCPELSGSNTEHVFL